jgi:hypothetical protein
MSIYQPLGFYRWPILLCFIEFLYVSAQPLHKVNVTKRNPIEDYAIGAWLARKGKS